MIHEVKPEHQTIKSLGDLAGRLFRKSFPSMDYDREFFLSYCASLVESGVGAIWLTSPTDKIDDAYGGMGCFLSTNPYTGKRQSTVLFWFVEPEHRGSMESIRLIKKWVSWSEAQGARHLFISSLPDSPSDPKMTRLYQKLGFTLTETVFRRAL